MVQSVGENKRRIMETDPKQIRIRELMEKYVLARIRKDQAAKIKTEAENDLTAVTLEITDYMADAGLHSVNFEDLGSLLVKEPTPRPSYNKSFEEDVRKFLRENGGADLIRETVNASSFASFIKEKITEGVTIPEFIKIYFQPSVTYTASKQDQSKEN